MSETDKSTEDYLDSRWPASYELPARAKAILIRAIDDAVAAERERCAKIAEDVARERALGTESHSVACTIFARIRSV